MKHLPDVGRPVRAWMRARAAPAIAMAAFLLGYGADVPAQDRNSRIAFSTERDGNYEIYVMRPDGTGLSRLTQNPAMDTLPMWSSTRRRLAFWSARNGEHAIYTMDADGSGVRKLVTVPPGTYGWAWSPDGNSLAFSSERDGDDEIYVMDADGGRWRNISNHAATLEYAPAWSPDGERVAFVSSRDGPRRIYAVDADGGNAELLITPGAVEEDPAWSPDGRRLAFLSRRRDLVWKDVWVADVGGANARNLTLPADGEQESNASKSAWSPDGRQIAYGYYRLGDPNARAEVFTTSVDDPDPRNLTEHPARDWTPVWFNPRGLEASPLHSRLTTWGWPRHTGGRGR